MLKYLNILSKPDKFKILIMLLIGLSTSILEALSIGLIIPLIVILIEPNKSFDNDFIDKFLKFFENLNLLNLNHLILLFLIVFLLKNFILFYFIYLQGKFSSTLNKNLSEIFFANYFLKNYNFFLKKNSQTILSDIQNGIGIFSQKYISPLISLILEVILVCILFSIMLITNPKLSFLVIIVLSSIAFIFTFFFKKKIKNNGEETQELLGIKYNILNEIYYNIKDIKIFSKENLYINTFNKIVSKFFRLELFHAVVSQTPKLIVEITAIFLILGFLYFSHNYYNVETKIIFIQITVFAAIIYRMVPSYNRIMFNFQMIKFAIPFCKKLSERYSELDLNKYKYKKNLKDDFIGNIKKIQFKNISYNYPNNKKNVLDNLSFEISLEKITGIKGDTGTGKTSIIDILIGLLEPSSGKVLVNEKDISINIDFWKNKIGYVPQKANLFNGTLEENIAFFDKNPDATKLKKVIKLCFLEELLERDKKDIKAISETGKGLSGGQLQKIAIARALYVNPELLILDESTNSLDSETEKKIFENLAMMDHVKVLIISHHMQTLEYCDTIFQLSDNNLVKIK